MQFYKSDCRLRRHQSSATRQRTLTFKRAFQSERDFKTPRILHFPSKMSDSEQLMAEMESASCEMINLDSLVVSAAGSFRLIEPYNAARRVI